MTVATRAATLDAGCAAACGPADRCPRCGGPFRCGVADAAPCPCTTVDLTADHRIAIAARHAGCLCTDCLAAIARGASA